MFEIIFTHDNGCVTMLIESLETFAYSCSPLKLKNRLKTLVLQILLDKK